MSISATECKLIDDMLGRLFTPGEGLTTKEYELLVYLLYKERKELKTQLRTARGA